MKLTEPTLRQLRMDFRKYCKLARQAEEEAMHYARAVQDLRRKIGRRRALEQSQSQEGK